MAIQPTRSIELEKRIKNSKLVNKNSLIGEVKGVFNQF